MITPELIGIIIGVATVLITIIVIGVMIIHKIDGGDARTEAKVESARTESKTDIAGVRTELKADIAGVRTELKTDIAGVRTELKADIANARTELKADITESGARAEAQSLLIIAEIRRLRESVDHRLNGIEREQARQEGILSVLVQRDRVAETDSSDREASED